MLALYLPLLQLPIGVTVNSSEQAPMLFMQGLFSYYKLVRASAEEDEYAASPQAYWPSLRLPRQQRRDYCSGTGGSFATCVGFLRGSLTQE
jgi:hypothetical protein